MTVPVADDVLAIAPELNCETQATINLFLEMAELRINATVWGKFYKAGVSYLAAHLITLKNRRGTAGGAITLKVGDVEVQYSDLMRDKKMDLAYLQTSYGLEYLNLRSLVVVTPITI